MPPLSVDIAIVLLWYKFYTFSTWQLIPNTGGSGLVTSAALTTNKMTPNQSDSQGNTARGDEVKEDNSGSPVGVVPRMLSWCQITDASHGDQFSRLGILLN